MKFDTSLQSSENIRLFLPFDLENTSSAVISSLEQFHLPIYVIGLDYEIHHLIVCEMRQNSKSFIEDIASIAPLYPNLSKIPIRDVLLERISPIDLRKNILPLNWITVGFHVLARLTLNFWFSFGYIVLIYVMILSIFGLLVSSHRKQAQPGRIYAFAFWIYIIHIATMQNFFFSRLLIHLCIHLTFTSPQMQLNGVICSSLPVTLAHLVALL